MLGELVSARIEHAVKMAPNMRAAEVKELADGEGLTPEAALLRELARSSSAWAWVIDGEVACMFGVVEYGMLDITGYPWFLTTPLVDQHAKQFARACKTLLPELLARHPRLVGMVEARYTLSVRWLQWLGAKMSEPEPWGIAGELWMHFELGA
jgi:hypothetical protein